MADSPLIAAKSRQAPKKKGSGPKAKGYGGCS